MWMHLKDVVILGPNNDNNLCVVARFGALGYEWPKELIDGRGYRYKFSHNETMADWMVGNYSGHATYIPIKG